MFRTVALAIDWIDWTFEMNFGEMQTFQSLNFREIHFANQSAVLMFLWRLAPGAVSSFKSRGLVLLVIFVGVQVVVGATVLSVERIEMTPVNLVIYSSLIHFFRKNAALLKQSTS